VIDPSCKILIRALGGGWRYEQTKKDTEKLGPEKNIYSHPGDGSRTCAATSIERRKKGRRTAANARPVLPTFRNPYALR
jgi:hypothetical protein